LTTQHSEKNFDPAKVASWWDYYGLEYFKLGEIALGMSLSDLKRDCPYMHVINIEDIEQSALALKNGISSEEQRNSLILWTTLRPPLRVEWTSSNLHMQ